MCKFCELLDKKTIVENSIKLILRKQANEKGYLSYESDMAVNISHNRLNYCINCGDKIESNRRT